jgi:hypothetical protein
MLKRTLTLNLPEPLLTRFEAQAQASARTVNEVVVEALVRSAPPAIEVELPLPLQQELKAMENLSDEALWAIARSVMNHDKLAFYDLLLERHQDRTITPEGLQLLEQLRTDADQLMARKAHAYALLKTRGHAIPNSKSRDTAA